MSKEEPRDGREQGVAASVVGAVVRRFKNGAGTTVADVLAVERALAISVEVDGQESLVTTTMRTPGADRELAAGFLLGERVIERADELRGVRQREADAVVVELAAVARGRLAAASRRFVTSSACGVCGRDDVTSLLPTKDGRKREAPLLPSLTPDLLQRMPQRLRDGQAAFAETGGLHAAGLFDVGGRLLDLREDVGRHNAVDKVIGAAVLAGDSELPSCVLVVSGRASFELVQKAAVARIPGLLAIGAPSSLAVDVATDNDMTLLGFVRDDGFNVYAHGARLRIAGLG